MRRGTWPPRGWRRSRAAIALTEANIRETEETIRNMSLFAPFDGTVVEKQGEEGEVITPSAMSSTTGRSAVVSLADLSKMEVETDVAENLLSRVALGQPAEISVSAVPSKHYRGRLRQIIPMGDRTRGTVKVKVEILDPDEHLFPELVATVHFLPDKALEQPRREPFVPVRPQGRPLRGERPRDTPGSSTARARVRKRRVEVAVTTDELARVESGLKRGRVGRPESRPRPCATTWPSRSSIESPGRVASIRRKAWTDCRETAMIGGGGRGWRCARPGSPPRPSRHEASYPSDPGFFGPSLPPRCGRRSAEGVVIGVDETYSIVLNGVIKEYRRDEFRIPVLVDLDLTVDGGGIPGPDGALGLGQDDPAEPDRRARPRRRGAR